MVKASPNTSAPAAVATTGSMEAMMAAALARILLRPTVYSRYGSTAVTKAVTTSRSRRLPGLGTVLMIPAISTGLHKTSAPAAPNRNA